MYKTISNEIIRSFKPCYDPSKYIKDENEELSIKDWIKKYRDIVPIKDIFWLLLRSEFLSGKDLSLFAVWCARETLKIVENTNIKINEVYNIVEKYVNEQATIEEFVSASDTAYATISADYVASYIPASVYISYHIAQAANSIYIFYVAAHAAYVAAHAVHATHTNHDAIYTSIYADYAANAAHAASRDAARINAVSYNVQLDQLLTYFE
jgi:hypothetical protein